MKQSDSIKELAAALAKAQGKIKPASKDATNPHLKSKYASLAALWEAIRGPLSENGLSVVQMPEYGEAGGVALTTVLTHQTGEWISATYALIPQQATPQGYGSAITYMRRYALASLVGVVADDDDDGQTASQGRAPQASPKPAQPNQPATDDMVTPIQSARIKYQALALKAADMEIDAPELPKDATIEQARAMYAALQAHMKARGN